MTRIKDYPKVSYKLSHFLKIYPNTLAYRMSTGKINWRTSCKLVRRGQEKKAIEGKCVVKLITEDYRKRKTKE